MSVDAAPPIVISGLRKSFPGGIVAINGLDLTVRAGTVYGLIGRNAAGKTTALRLLMGLLRANGGTARVFGHDLMRATAEVRARAAYVSQDLHLPPAMTTSELCAYCSCFYPRWDAGLAKDLARRWGLTPERRVGLLSGGQRRRVAILLALACRAEVLVLDEPAAGLDPLARRELIEELIEALGRQEGCTVLFSTHIIADLERIANDVGVMEAGRLITAGGIEELRERTKRVQVVFPGDALPTGFAIPGAVRMHAAGAVATAIVRSIDEATLSGLRAIPGARVQVFPLGLEDILVELIGQTPDAEPVAGAR
jgi:ABC-2 type transport system ATP-binding protein